jgi:hypothetical protein
LTDRDRRSVKTNDINNLKFFENRASHRDIGSGLQFGNSAREIPIFKNPKYESKNEYYQKNPLKEEKIKPRNSRKSLPRNLRNTLQSNNNVQRHSSRPSSSLHRLNHLLSKKNEFNNKKDIEEKESVKVTQWLPLNPDTPEISLNSQLFKREISHTLVKNMEDSDITNSKIMKLFDHVNLIHEIFYRYSHEINKILFWLQTIKQIFDFLYESKICKAVLIFGCFLLIKAKIRIKFLYNSLVKRKNKYKMIRFDEFLESSKYEEILIKFRKLASMVSQMEKNLANEERFLYFIKSYKLEKVLKGKINDVEYQRVMNSQLIGIINDKVTRSSNKNE